MLLSLSLGIWQVVTTAHRASCRRKNQLVDRDAAVGGLEAEGGATGAEVRIDGAAMDAVLVGVGEVEGGSSIGGVGDEVGGVAGGELDTDSAVGGAGGEATSLPGVAGEDGLDATVGGGDVDVAGEVFDMKTAVGGFAVDVTADSGELEATVHSVELAGELVRDEELVANGPVAVAGEVRAVGFDGASGFNGYFMEDGGGLGLAASTDADLGFEGDVVAVLADDLDASVCAIDVEVSVNEGEGGGTDFAGLLAVEPVGDHAAMVLVGAGVGCEVLGGERQNG